MRKEPHLASRNIINIDIFKHFVFLLSNLTSVNAGMFTIFTMPGIENFYMANFMKICLKLFKHEVTTFVQLQIKSDWLITLTI